MVVTSMDEPNVLALPPVKARRRAAITLARFQLATLRPHDVLGGLVLCHRKTGRNNVGVVRKAEAVGAVG